MASKCVFEYNSTHLSKGNSDLKHYFTQLLTSFSGTVFLALMLGMIYFLQLAVEEFLLASAGGRS